MFERFIRFSQIKRALREERVEEALKLLGDPVIAADRRAADLKAQALRQILCRAQRRKARGDHAPALTDVELVLAAQPEFAGAINTPGAATSAIAPVSQAEGFRYVTWVRVSKY